MERLNQILTSYKIPLVVSLVGVMLIIGGVVNNAQPDQPKSFPIESIVSSVGATSESLKVNVSGAVHKPGVITLKSEDRVEDAIKAAGGFTDDANASYISKVVNLSQKVSDGQKIYIPFQGETAPAAVGGVASNATQATSGVVGLNTATQAQLEALPGIGAVTAQKIISNRPYTDLSQLTTHKIVSAKVYGQIKNLVDLN